MELLGTDFRHITYYARCQDDVETYCRALVVYPDAGTTLPPVHSRFPPRLRMVAKKIMDPENYDLTAEEQEKIVEQFCVTKLDEIKKLQHGNMIYDFLLNVISFCKAETFTDTYSYRSVTGFAVTEENTGKYGGDGFWFQNPGNEKLATILKDCLAYNLLEKATTTQGKKDQQWSVFYLNRWLCAYAHLPLGHGGWRKLTLSKLNKWVEPAKK